MKCSKIKPLLSEYIDETLDAHTRSRVEQHLLECKTCQKDYSDLKNIIGEVRELPAVGAPDDFLESLHARMESRFDLKKIGRTLFVPFKIKIPLELLSAAAAAMIIFFFINVFQQENQVSDFLYSKKGETLDNELVHTDTFKMEANEQMSEEKDIVKRESTGVSQLKKPEKTPPKMFVAKETREKIAEPSQSAPAPAAQETVAAFRSEPKLQKTETPIQLTLRLDTSASGKPYASIAAMDKQDQSLGDREYEQTIDKQRSVGESDATDLKSGREEKKAGASKSKENMLSESPQEGAPLQSIDDRVRSIVQANEGKVVSINVDEKTQQPVSILTDIPASKFKTFSSQLGQIGRLEQPLPVIDETTNELLRVNILLISSP